METQDTSAAPFSWLSSFLVGLGQSGIRVTQGDVSALAPARLLEVPAADWGGVAAEAKAFGLRWCGLWGDESDGRLRVNVCFAYKGDYLLVRAALPGTTLSSHTPWYPAADRPERHARDLYGIQWADHPDPRRWTRHQAWREDEVPLRAGFPLEGQVSEQTPPDHDYPFLQAQGSGVYEIPVGPVHAGIIEPGHFRFQAVGEAILNLELRLGYVHKGIEKIAMGRDGDGLARLAGRVAGDSTVAHAWAACMALERAVAMEAPPRANAIRALLAERERVANHLWDVATVCNDVAFAFVYYQLGRLREEWLRTNAAAMGHRLLMDGLVPGGVRQDLGACVVGEFRQQNQRLRQELEEIMAIADGNASLQDRIKETGVLGCEDAATLGCLGYVGRASGVDLDARRDHRYAPYDRLSVRVPLREAGDVAARMQIRIEEIFVSLDLQDRLLDELPEGPHRLAWHAEAEGEGLGVVEGWRGEIVSYVRLDPAGRVARFFPRDPSWHTWPALERLVRGNIVPDFPVCNKSVNGAYSGQDL